jgi:hypothetical protein
MEHYPSEWNVMEFHVYRDLMIEISIRSHQAHDTVRSYMIGILKLFTPERACEKTTGFKLHLCPFAQKHCEDSDGTQTRGSVVLDVAEWL